MIVTDQSPMVLIRVGQSTDAVPVPAGDYGVITEDINKDKSSIWMVTDQVIPLLPLTKTLTAMHHRSVRQPPSGYSGNQVVINSDRIVINSKGESIFMYSGNSIHTTTVRDTTADMGGDYISYIGGTKAIEIVADEAQNVGRDSILWYGQDAVKQIARNYLVYVGREAHLHSKDKISLVSRKVFVGSINDIREPMVLGKSLVLALVRLIDAHLAPPSGFVSTSIISGPSTLDTTVRDTLNTLRRELEEMILSKDNFVSKRNEHPIAPPERHLIHPR